MAPLYLFNCSRCGDFDDLLPVSDYEKIVPCPTCGKDKAVTKRAGLPAVRTEGRTRAGGFMFQGQTMKKDKSLYRNTRQSYAGDDSDEVRGPSV